jgi:adenosylcobinamide-GDP ribazoletransferase
MGLMLVLSCYGSSIFPISIQAVLLTLFLCGISGALHLDGLSDTFDGFLSSRPKDRILEIMKDSHIGVMGAMAMIFVILLKITSLYEILSRGSLPVLALVLVPFLGRCALIHSMVQLPYARAEGLGRLFWYENKSVHYGLLLVEFLLSISFLGFWGLGFMAFIYAVQCLFIRWCSSKIDGGTGDTCGACCELTETLALVLLTLF